MFVPILFIYLFIFSILMFIIVTVFDNFILSGCGDIGQFLLICNLLCTNFFPNEDNDMINRISIKLHYYTFNFCLMT